MFVLLHIYIASHRLKPLLEVKTNWKLQLQLLYL